MTDLAYLSLLSSSYTTTPTIQSGDVRLVVTRLPTMRIVCIPGTRPDVLADWARDFAAWPHVSRTHPRLGECHDGCLTGAESVLDALLAAVGHDPWAIACHSLGGGIGTLLAALADLYDCPPSRIVTCGSMRSCIGGAVPGILAHIAGVHLVDRGDFVPDEPPLYTEWRARTLIGAASGPDVRRHFMSAYLGAAADSVRGIAPAVPAI